MFIIIPYTRLKTLYTYLTPGSRHCTHTLHPAQDIVHIPYTRLKTLYTYSSLMQSFSSIISSFDEFPAGKIWDLLSSVAVRNDHMIIITNMSLFASRCFFSSICNFTQLTMTSRLIRLCSQFQNIFCFYSTELIFHTPHIT